MGNLNQISLFTEYEVRFIKIQKKNFRRLSISFLNWLIRHLCCIFPRFRRTNLSFFNFILREFAHFITCDIYIKKKISNCTQFQILDYLTHVYKACMKTWEMHTLISIFITICLQLHRYLSQIGSVFIAV